MTPLTRKTCCKVMSSRHTRRLGLRLCGLGRARYDRSQLDRHPATQGLGPLGHTACHGLLVHTTLAFTPERVPLGLLAQQVWARDPNDVGKRARRKHLPISQKESQKWLHSLDAVYTARDCCPTTRLVSVGDREADVYDVLAARTPGGRRSADSRRVGPVCPGPRALYLGHGCRATGGRTPPVERATSWATGGPGRHVGAAVLRL